MKEHIAVAVAIDDRGVVHADHLDGRDGALGLLLVRRQREAVGLERAVHLFVTPMRQSDLRGRIERGRDQRPGGDGCEAAEQARCNVEHGTLPVLLLALRAATVSKLPCPSCDPSFASSNVSCLDLFQRCPVPAI